MFDIQTESHLRRAYNGSASPYDEAPEARRFPSLFAMASHVGLWAIVIVAII
ncbi:MAG: hypothetical protein ACK4YU_12765 [Paracoccus sp. (in: a-proteobacteria)]